MILKKIKFPALVSTLSIDSLLRFKPKFHPKIFTFSVRKYHKYFKELLLFKKAAARRIKVHY
jgi:hypothetical protein